MCLHQIINHSLSLPKKKKEFCISFKILGGDIICCRLCSNAASAGVCFIVYFWVNVAGLIKVDERARDIANEMLVWGMRKL